MIDRFAVLVKLAVLLSLVIVVGSVLLLDEVSELGLCESPVNVFDREKLTVGERDSVGLFVGLVESVTEGVGIVSEKLELPELELNELVCVVLPEPVNERVLDLVDDGLEVSVRLLVVERVGEASEAV